MEADMLSNSSRISRHSRRSGRSGKSNCSTGSNVSARSTENQVRIAALQAEMAVLQENFEDNIEVEIKQLRERRHSEMKQKLFDIHKDIKISEAKGKIRYNIDTALILGLTFCETLPRSFF